MNTQTSPIHSNSLPEISNTLTPLSPSPTPSPFTKQRRAPSPTKSLIGEADCGGPGFIRRKMGLSSPFSPNQNTGVRRPTPKLQPEMGPGTRPWRGVLGGEQPPNPNLNLQIKEGPTTIAFDDKPNANG